MPIPPQAARAVLDEVGLLGHIGPLMLGLLARGIFAPGVTVLTFHGRDSDRDRDSAHHAGRNDRFTARQ